jgi:hypothetical protein
MNPECISKGERVGRELDQRTRPFLLVLAILAFSSVALAESSPDLLWVQMCDSTGLGPAQLAEVEREVAAIYLQAGIEIQWVERCGGERIELAHPGAARVYILDQLPKALLGMFRKIKKNNNVMGFTPTAADAKPGAAIYVSRDSVEWHATEFRSKPLAESQLMRALGRVVAHELAHRFLGQVKHTRRGILRVDYDRSILTKVEPDKLGFTDKQADELRQLARLGVSEDKVSVGSSGS